MIVDFDKLDESTLEGKKLIIFGEDHGTAMPYVNDLINLVESDVFLTEHIMFYTLHGKQEIKRHLDNLDKDFILAYRYTKPWLDMLYKNRHIKHVVGMDYHPDSLKGKYELTKKMYGHLNDKEISELKKINHDYLEVVDKMAIGDSFDLREKRMVQTIEESLRKTSKPLFVSVGDTHLREKSYKDFNRPSPITKKYKDRNDAIIIRMPAQYREVD